MEKNDDYKKGMAYLLKACKEKRINIRKCEWVPIVLGGLSKHQACFAFCQNIIAQGNLDRIELCHSTYDIFHRAGCCLFQWNRTPEGSKYWDEMESIIYKSLGI